MATISDVAKRAGVSSTTVSHVINLTRHVKPDTRERVERAITELGYRRDPVARMLAGGGSGAVGLVTSGLSNPYFGPLLSSIERGITKAGLLLVLSDSHDEPEMEHRVIESMLERRIEGLIIAPSAGFSRDSYLRITEPGTPLVMIDRGLPMECDKVVPENREATRRLTEHLIAHGHRRIAAVTGLAGLESTKERRLGYEDALRINDIPVIESLVVNGQSDARSSFQVVRQLLERGPQFSAMVTLNNAMTIGAMQAIREIGLRIPDDVALVAYDDFEWSDIFSPGLTAISQDVEQMGSVAVDLLLRRIGGDKSPFARRVLEPSLHLRDSCGCDPMGVLRR